MNLRHLNLVGQCTMCMLPVAAFRSVSSKWIVSMHGRSRCVDPNLSVAFGRGSAFGTAPPCGRFSGSIGKDDVQSSAEVKIASASRMEEVGAFFGSDAQSGDTVLLHGDLGSGKTCFARGFIRARTGDPGLAVTSPSYLLDNTYHVDHEDVTVHHMDLYRLQGGADLRVLDIPNVMKTNVCLIEWPDRLGAAKPVNRLDVHLTAATEDERVITVTGHGDWWAGVVQDFQEFRERLPEGYFCSSIREN